MQIQEFLKMFHYLAVTYSIDIIAGDFNYDLLKIVRKQTFRYFHRQCLDGK